MQFDLRFPIGLLFIGFGVTLTIFGLVTPEDMYLISLGINVNLVWGIVMLVFGGIMLGLALARKRKGAAS
ncbi:MAG: hypothetical protein LBB40_02760 [Holophagales bacterium]|jgi:hypothetical protein|nr:hypothetical protein [Holophagales bacterium]